MEVAEKFSTLADLLEIEGANPFRVRAYRNAARVITSLPSELRTMVEEGQDLSELPAIGEDLAGKIEEILKTGHLRTLSEAEKRVGKGTRELLEIRGLGPKKVARLQKALKIHSIAGLRKAVANHRLSSLHGFGALTEKRIQVALEQHNKAHSRTKISIADSIATPLITYLQNSSGIKEVLVAGSCRRREETVGDIDIVVSASMKNDVIARFIQYEDVQTVLVHGTTKASVLLRSDIQVDLRIVEEKSFGAALYYFTGSKSHNVAVRLMAEKKGLKINEYGVFKGVQQVAGRTEHEVFRAVGLPYIEPELRENNGEIDAAIKGCLPKLISLSDLRGDLHVHTDATDGRETLEQMAAAAKAKGYQYIAITDHSQHLTVAHGLTPKQLFQQVRQIDKLNGKLSSFTILKAVEVDILEDGSLDLPDDILKELDLTVCSIHSKFHLPRAKQTERVLRAMDNPHFCIFGHPTGRLIGNRDPSDLDIERIMEAAKERGCIMELNSQPDRLDLSNVYCKLAHELQVKVAISTDAHAGAELDLMRYGIGQARRGWLEKTDVVNTCPLEKLRKMLKRG